MLPFPWLPVEAAISIFNFTFLIKTRFLEKELMKTNDIDIIAGS